MKVSSGLRKHLAMTWKGLVAAFASMLTVMGIFGLFLSFSSTENFIFWNIDPSSIDVGGIQDHFFTRHITEVQKAELVDIGITSPTKFNQSLIQEQEQEAQEESELKGQSEREENGRPLISAIDEQFSNQLCDENKAQLKVYMYDLPAEFHFGMIETRAADSIWPKNASQILRYPGGLYLQHSPEYWLTLDLLFPDTTSMVRRVKNPREADVFFVPFFSSLSYNKYSRSASSSKDAELQRKLLQYLVKQPAWMESGGKNHIIMMHHPNSLHVARNVLGATMYIVADFGRYRSQIANVDKDVVAPYKHLLPSYEDDESTYDSRTTLLFFQGAIVRKEGGVIRQKLYNLVKDEKGAQFSEGNPQRQGIRSATVGMRSSKFCLNLAGDTPSSNRLFDAIASHCVPVIISHDIELPYEDELDYTQFCLFVHPTDAIKKGFLMRFLRSIGKEEWTGMWKMLKEVQHHFEYQFPSQENDAVQMIWKSVARRVPRIRLSMHKAGRYSRSGLMASQKVHRYTMSKQLKS